MRLATTLDQLLAKKFGQDTLFPSLELATEDFAGLIGSCDDGYQLRVSQHDLLATPTTPLPMEINPRVVFERMFGDSGHRRSGAGAHAGGPQHPRFSCGRRIAP